MMDFPLFRKELAAMSFDLGFNLTLVDDLRKLYLSFKMRPILNITISGNKGATDHDD